MFPLEISRKHHTVLLTTTYGRESENPWNGYEGVIVLLIGNVPAIGSNLYSAACAPFPLIGQRHINDPATIDKSTRVVRYFDPVLICVAIGRIRCSCNGADLRGLGGINPTRVIGNPSQLQV